MRESGRYVLCVDIKNAFNELDRAVIASFVERRLGGWLRQYWNMAYGSPTTVRFQTGNVWEDIIAERGVRQGCPAASFLYDAITGEIINLYCISTRPSFFPS